MDILKFCETEVPALSDATRCIDIHMTAKGRVLFAVSSKFVRIEVPDITGKSFLCERVPFRVLGGHIVQKKIDRIDCGHTVALPHDPGSGVTCNGIDGHISGIGWYHIEGTAGMSFRDGFKILGGEFPTIEIDVPGIGLMDYQPHGSTRHSIQSVQQIKEWNPISLDTTGGQKFRHGKDPGLRLHAVIDRTVTLCPAVCRRIPSPVERHPLFFTYVSNFFTVGHLCLLISKVIFSSISRAVLMRF
jgi:hypothetical protein